LALVIVGRIGAQEGDGRLFDETGQLLDNQYGFLQFWERHRGAELYGPPITGIVLEANVPVQYFERGRLEYRGDTVVPGAIARERTRWRPFPAARSLTPRAGMQVFKETGHTLSGDFLIFWRENDGEVVFGPPLSEPLWETIDGTSVRVQYFERARLEQRPATSGESVTTGLLGREIALAKGLILPDQQPAQAIIEVAGSLNEGGAFAEMAPPTPTPIPPTATPIPTPPPDPPTRVPAPANTNQAPAKPTPQSKPKPAAPPTSAGVGGKVIDVNLSTQRLVALQDGEVVYITGVATGKDGFNTPAGTFSIYSKTKLRTMRGSLGGETWVVPNVPNVLYFNGAVALHGTYWHNMFGTGVRMSHGCVNLSLKDAEWIYNWAPVGTKVIVHY
jgi:lipoprotein-anchoring transpeptidase ErfK/SrfK